MSEKLTKYAEQGYKDSNSKNPHLYSSPAHIAYMIGEYFLITGRTMPVDVRMSRGYSIRVRDMIFKWTEYGAGINNFERIK